MASPTESSYMCRANAPNSIHSANAYLFITASRLWPYPAFVLIVTKEKILGWMHTVYTKFNSTTAGTYNVCKKKHNLGKGILLSALKPPTKQECCLGTTFNSELNHPPNVKPHNLNVPIQTDLVLWAECAFS